ncbi:nuclear pore complex protein Nup50-like [Watersipora subatra]|uniref:nuclear pore complex protein Nup50-like n=1 Tax=Watersipora subatra TaxID=2589382 RepID=UPI00355B9927
MSNKRSATSQLHQDNWDDEEEQEEAGEFKQADASELKERVIKKAKRRGVLKEDLADKPALFTGFQGFGIPLAQNPTFSFNKKEGETTSAVKFSPLATSNGDSNSSVSVSENITSSTKEKVDVNRSKFLAALKVLNESMLKWLTSHTEKNPYCFFTPVFADYDKHLSSLKQRYQFEQGDASSKNVVDISEADATESPKPSSTAAMISSATTPATSIAVTSPTPLFTFGTTKKVEVDSTCNAEQGDNSKQEDNTERGDNSREGDKPVSSLFNFGTKSSPPKTDKAPIKPFSFLSQPVSGTSKSDNNSIAASEEKLAATSTAPMFSFGTKAPANTSSVTGSIFGPTSSTSGTFSFGLTKSTTTTSSSLPTFSFGKTVSSGNSSISAGSTAATSGFSFKSEIAKAKTEETQAAPSNEEEEYVPPKPEVENKITEDDALYTKRVKLFYNKDGKYVDKGVGNLFIKPLESGKNGVLIRADTNLGTILLNISLSDSIPIQRMGKNNVTLVCVPNPPMEVGKGAPEPPPPTMLLIRVKESSDADELFEKLNEYKSDS